MKIAAHVLAYNVDPFLKRVLENIEPHVDKIYIAHSDKPWGYNNKNELSSNNPTTLESVKKASENIKNVEIIQGNWSTEEDMRNECLAKAREQCYDWFVIQDADEFYTKASWAQIKTVFLEDVKNDLLITTWYNFWKSSHYVLTYKNGGIKGTNAGFAIRCNSQVTFIRKRICNADKTRIIDCPCYHYGYVMSDAQMHEKLTTWGHTNEFDPAAWYKYKWKYWNDTTTYLHPTSPGNWHRAIRFPNEQPDFAQYFDLPVNVSYLRNFNDMLSYVWYRIKERRRILERALRSISSNSKNNSK